MQDRITEIESFLHHNDHSLTVRRMLDLAFDLNNEALLLSVIEWSKNYRQALKQNKEELPASFFENASQLLLQMQDAKPSFHYRQERLLRTENISKAYITGHFKLHPISLDVNTGDVIGIVGENGNGKTTLLRSVAGQLSIDTGGIEYSTLNKADAYSVRQHLAFIPQRIPRWYGQLKDNLHFSAALAGVRGRQNEIMVEFMLERMNLSDYAHLTWEQVSSGYRTRFEIARVLLQKPKLMLLDEPLANLDILAQQTILTDLRYLVKSTKNPMGVLLSSQQLHEVEKIADTVLFIKQGQCLYRTKQNEETKQVVLEIETNASREKLSQLFNAHKVQIQFNGGYYTIASSDMSVNQMLNQIISNDMQVSYFRDITYSTKRFF